MNSIGHMVLRLLLVLLLCIGMSQFVAAGDGNLTSARSTVGNNSLSQNQSRESSLGTALKVGSEEPLQMMVSGLILFAIATTFRRFRSRNRVSAELKDR